MFLEKKHLNKYDLAEKSEKAHKYKLVVKKFLKIN